jgi:peptide/nickel transport system substrate-binding protein
MAGNGQRRAGPRITCLLAVLALLGFTACGDDTDGGNRRSGEGQESSLTFTTGFTIDDLAPLDNGQWAAEFGYGELLMRPLPGGELEPWVLESLEQVDDTTWELTLPEGVTFQNGNPLDGAVLADLLVWHLAHNTRIPALFDGAAVEATDDLVVEITTTEPLPSLPSVLANEGSFVLFDLATYEQHEDAPEDLVGAGIYTGPYEVVRLSSAEMQLVASDSHYGGTPALDEVAIQFVPDEQSRIQAVQAGQADIALYPPTAAAHQLDGRDDSFFLTQAEGQATVGMLLFVNQASEALAETEVRQAVQLATDYEAVAHEVMNGLYDPSPGLYPSVLPYTRDLLRTDPDRAEELLDNAGWERDGDGTRVRDGEDLVLRFLTYPQQPDTEVIGVALQGQLRGIGVAVELVEVDDVYGEMESDSGWELALSNEHAADLTGSDPLRPLLNHYRSDGIWNFGRIDDPELDDLIDELSVTSDEAEREALLEAIQERVVVDGAYGWYVALRRVPVVAGPEARDYPVPAANLWLSPYL